MIETTRQEISTRGVESLHTITSQVAFLLDLTDFVPGKSSRPYGTCKSEQSDIPRFACLCPIFENFGRTMRKL